MTMTVDVDDSLVREARRETGIKSDNELLARALNKLVDAAAFQKMLELENSGAWEGPDEKVVRQ